MTQPPDGYPSPEPGAEHPPPADPFYGPPSWEPPTQPTSRQGGGAPGAPYGPPPAPPPGQPGGPPPGLGGQPPYDPPPYGPPAPHSPAGPPQSPPGPPPYGGGPPGPPVYGGGQPPYDPPDGAGGAAGRRRRGLVILGAALAGALVLCAGAAVGGWLLLRDPDRDGSPTPNAAVQAFLQAVYREQDPAAAAELVCSEARDRDALAAKIDELRAYQETQVDPAFQWTDPEVVDEGDRLAVVAVTVTMVTGDEKVADQPLRVSVLDKDPHGWWVCDLESTDEPAGEPPAEPTEGAPADGDGSGDDADDEGDDG